MVEKTNTNNHRCIHYVFYKLRKFPEKAFKAFCITVILFLYSGSIVAESELTLHYDPFQKPVLTRAKQPMEGRSQSIQVNWEPKLHATLVAGKNSMVNVNGTSIKLGERFQGYRLIKVRNSTAIFVKTPHKIELTIK